jgi:hypothetical protein
MIHRGTWDSCVKQAETHLPSHLSDWILLRKDSSDFVLEGYPDEVEGIRWIRETLWHNLIDGLEDSVSELNDLANAPEGFVAIAIRARRSASGRFLVGVVYARR